MTEQQYEPAYNYQQWWDQYVLDNPRRCGNCDTPMNADDYPGDRYCPNPDCVLFNEVQNEFEAGNNPHIE